MFSNVKELQKGQTALEVPKSQSIGVGKSARKVFWFGDFFKGVAGVSQGL